MGIQAPAEVKYQLIYEAIRSDQNELTISYMCKFAGVSRSGFYAWIDAIDARKRREEADRVDYELIKQAFDFCGYDKGARGIGHNLETRELTRRGEVRHRDERDQRPGKQLGACDAERERHREVPEAYRKAVLDAFRKLHGGKYRKIL